MYWNLEKWNLVELPNNKWNVRLIKSNMWEFIQFIRLM